MSITNKLLPVKHITSLRTASWHTALFPVIELTQAMVPDEDQECKRWI